MQSIDNNDDGIGEYYEKPAPLPLLATAYSALKERIRQHYDVASEYYYSLWSILYLTFFLQESI